jgi:hypothetical protein
MEVDSVMPRIVLIEKCCSWCGKLNWDSEKGGYNEDCDHPKRAGKKCDISGEERKWDENNNRVY